MNSNSAIRATQVAVIVPVHNGAAFIRETMDSILRQEGIPFIVYVVDDGSTDETSAMLRQYSDDSRVRVLTQENRGQAAAINHGLTVSQEPYVALCDVDDLWRKDRLQRSVNELEKHNHWTMACSDFSRGESPELPWESAWQLRGYQPVTDQAFEQLLRENFVCRSTVLIRRRELEHHGNFCQEIGGKCGSDDRDMWLRLAREGSVGCIHQVLVWKRDCEAQGSTSIGFHKSQVRLWQAWKKRLANEPQYQALATSNLSTALHNLAWKHRELGQPIQSVLAELKTLGYRPDLLRVASNVTKTLVSQLLTRPKSSSVTDELNYSRKRRST